MAEVIKVKAKKAYEWNQDTKFVYVRIPVPSQTSLKKVDIFLSDLILRVTSLEKKSTHFLDLAYEVDYKSGENKFTLNDGEIHATLKKKQITQWDQLLIEDISLADLKTRRRESEARYEKNVQEVQANKVKMRDEYDRKATQQMMRFEQEQRKILDTKKKAEKDRAIEEIFSVTPKQQLYKPISNNTNLIQERKQLTAIEYEEKKWKSKEEQAMKLILEEEEKEKQQLKTLKKEQNQKKLITQIEKQVGLTSTKAQRASTSASMFTEEDIDSYQKMREQVGETHYEQIPIRKANKVQVKFTQRMFPHLAARDTHFKQPPMPKQSGKKGSSEGDIENKNPLWLKDKGDSFMKDKNYTSAIQAYTEAIKLDSNMNAALANRSLCYMKVFNFSGVIADCEQCLRVMKGNIGGSEEDKAKSIEFAVKIRTRLGMAKAWKGELEDAKKEFEEILANFDSLKPEISEQINSGIASVNLRLESIGYKNKGDEQVKLGQFQKAIHFYDQSISVDKNEYSASNKSLCLNKLNSFTQSIQTTNEGINRINDFGLVFSAGAKNVQPQNKRPETILLKLYYRKAKAYEQLSKIKEAEEAIQKGLAIDSTDKDFNQLLKEISSKKNKLIVQEDKQKAAQLIKQGNHSQALKIYTKCLKIIQTCDDIPQYLSLLQNQCVCYLKANDYDSIISTSIRILKLINNIQSKIVEFGDKKATLSREELDKIAVRTLMRRANAYLKKEQVYNAKGDLEKALEISPKDQTVLKELNKIKQILAV